VVDVHGDVESFAPQRVELFVPDRSTGAYPSVTPARAFDVREELLRRRRDHAQIRAGNV
jgi:hypothetical protein